MELKFTKSTDAEHEITLESYLISASWRSGAAYAGQKASFEVITAFVGNGAEIEIKGESQEGHSLGKIKDAIKNNRFVGEFEIPEDLKIGEEIFFEVKLPKNGLEGKSNRIPVLPPVEVTDMEWSAAEARRGDILTLSAKIRGVPDETEAKITIYEYDRDNIHDRITELPATVKGGKIEVQWNYEYHEDVDEIPTEDEMQRYGSHYNPPEYFFTVKIGEQEYGKTQESKLLTFKDWLEIRLTQGDGEPVPNADYIVHLPDGTERRGTLDGDGFAKEDKIPPGICDIEFPNL
jgi:hypothetical protein